MKTIILTISILVASFFSSAQQFEWLDSYEYDYRKNNLKYIILETDDEVVSYSINSQNSKKTETYWGPFKNGRYSWYQNPILTTINKTTKKIVTQNHYVAPFYSKEVMSTFEDCFSLSEMNIGLVHRNSGKKEVKVELFLMQMLKNGEWGTQTKVWDCNTLHGRKHPYTFISPDKSLVVIAADEEEMNEQAVDENKNWSFVISDSELKDLKSIDIQFKQAYDVQCLGVSNNAEVYFTVQTAQGLELRKYNAIAPGFMSVMLAENIGNGEIHTVKAALKQNTISVAVTLRALRGAVKDKNNTPVYLGRVNKIMMFNILLSTLEKKQDESVKLDGHDLLMSEYTDGYVVDHRLENSGLPNDYRIVNIDESENNTFVLLENLHSYKVNETYMDGGSQPKSTNVTYYDRTDLHLIVLSKTLNTVRVIRIPRRQHLRYGSGLKTFGYASSEGYNIFYRDIKENALLKEDDIAASPNKSETSMPLLTVYFDEKYQKVNKYIINEDEYEAELLPYITHKNYTKYNKNGTYWFMSTKYKVVTLGKYLPK